ASVTYADTSNNPNVAPRSISFVVSDGTLSSSPVTKSVGIVEVDQKPTITVPGSAQSVAQNSTLVLSSGNSNGITVADVDAKGSSEQVTVSVSSGTLSLGGTTGLTVTGTSANSSSIVFSGSLSNLNAALNGLVYQAPMVAGTATLSVAINDLGNTGVGGPQT